MLTRRDAVHHVLRLGLIAPADVVDGFVTANEYVGRNHLVRVEVGGGRGFVVKEPQSLAAPDAATMWAEAALFWMTVNDPTFAELAPWIPRFYHYDERNALLTIELVPDSETLYTLLVSGTPPRPETLRELGRIFARLHGNVSESLRTERTRKLFRTGPAWSLTLGTPEQTFFPSTDAGRHVLATVLGHDGSAAALATARGAWRDAHLIHGDAKATNVLVLPDGSPRVIDWEIVAIGDGLWDVAGFVHSLLIPNAAANVDDLVSSERRAITLLDALWSGYIGALPEAPPGDDPLVTMLRLAGTRLVQTCLETTLWTDNLDASLKATLAIGLELMTHPERTRDRWNRAA